MTKYILAGGCDRKHPEYVQSLARLILSEKPSPKILSCLFAVEGQEREEKFEEYRSYFLPDFGPKADMIMANQDTFIEQLDDSDVIYLHGGSTDLLAKTMSKYPEFSSHLANKIVVGSSAGANYIARAGYSPSLKQTNTLSGLVDIACIVHYGSSGFSGMEFTDEFWQAALAEMKELAIGRPIVLLPEGTFTVFEI